MKRKKCGGTMEKVGKSTKFAVGKRPKLTRDSRNWKVTHLKPNKETEKPTVCESELKVENPIQEAESEDKISPNPEVSSLNKMQKKRDTKEINPKRTKIGKAVSLAGKIKKKSDNLPKCDSNNTEDVKLPRLEVPDKFVWIDTAQYFQPLADIVSSDDEVEEEKQVPAKRKKRNNFQAQKREENMMYKTEKLLMDADRVPQTADDFDRAVLASPDNSLVWMQYMAFHLQSAEIDKARAVAERALKIIGFREEQEKLNVWVALLNLENLYGTKETLKAVLDRALQYNDSLKVYSSLAKIYFEANKFADAELIHKVVLKKYNLEQDAWIGAGTFYMRSGQHEKARELMERSLKNLDKRLHVDVICKFAQLEFHHGDPERGKLLFENVLVNYPKRTDKWSVYLDILIKLGNLDDIRKVFERVLKLKMAVRKMTVFFKKYLSFEMKFGTEVTVEAVRLKAKEFVDSKEMMEM